MRPSPRLHDRNSRSPRGFTLMELMIVILIIVLLSAAVIPTILPALNSRRVSEGSRLLQSELARQRDLAIRANAPRGIRLLPDPVDPARPNVLTSSRLVAIETAPDYSDGTIQRLDPYAVMLDGSGNIVSTTIDPVSGNPYPAPPAYLSIASALRTQGYFPAGSTPAFIVAAMKQLAIVHEVKVNDVIVGNPPSQAVVPLPSAPTSWFWNIRQGDKLRLSESGQAYTIAGPMLVSNPERLINLGQPASYTTGPASTNYEFLILVNGRDDTDPARGTGNGFVDEGFDGIDNDGDLLVDPGFNGIDDDGDGNIDNFAELFMHRDPVNGTSYPGVVATPPSFPGPFFNEFEPEAFVGKSRPNVAWSLNGVPQQPYVAKQEYLITRRPVPVEGAREISMPTNVVIDLTTWNADILFGQANVSERSRLPVDPYTGFVDVMVAPNGQIVVAGASANASPPVNFPYYHFWITERDDVNQPTPKDPANGKTFLLPMPKDSGNDPRIAGVTGSPALNNPVLRYERRLLSVNTRTGSIVPTAIETFYLNNPSYPFEAAESGQRDAQQ